MEFIKTHWSRLSIALLFLIGGALAIVFYIDEFAILGKTAAELGLTESEATGQKLFVLLPFVSALIYFFGMLAVMIFKTLGKKCVGTIYSIVGALVTLFYVVTLCMPWAFGMDATTYWMVVVPLLVFGLYPLIKGITKFVEADYAPKAAPAPVAKAK